MKKVLKIMTDIFWWTVMLLICHLGCSTAYQAMYRLDVDKVCDIAYRIIQFDEEAVVWIATIVMYVMFILTIHKIKHFIKK